jgi:hypothetical protein
MDTGRAFSPKYFILDFFLVIREYLNKVKFLLFEKPCDKLIESWGCGKNK